ncbi:MAG: hypothetical protein AB1633_01350 [Elusimicrobiota bacterium]
MAVIAIPRILREKLTDDGAEALVEVINKADDKSRDDVLLFVGDKIENRFSAFEQKYDSLFLAFEQKYDSLFLAFEYKYENRFTAFEEKIENRIKSFEEKVDNQFSAFEQKFENRIKSFEEKVDNQFSAFEQKFERRLAEETGGLRTELRTEISKTRADIIKWMFIFTFGQFWATTGVILSILFVFFRK